MANETTTAAAATLAMATGNATLDLQPPLSFVQLALTIGLPIGSFVSSLIAIIGIATLAAALHCRFIHTKGPEIDDHKVIFSLFVGSMLFHICVLLVMSNGRQFRHEPDYVFPWLSVLGILVIYVLVGMSILVFVAGYKMVSKVLYLDEAEDESRGDYEGVAGEEAKEEAV